MPMLYSAQIGLKTGAQDYPLSDTIGERRQTTKYARSSCKQKSCKA